MVLLTATLPPEYEATLWDRMYFRPEEVRIFRDTITRTNVRYAVEIIPGTVKPSEEDELVVQKVEEGLTAYPTGKVVVYANSVEKV